MKKIITFIIAVLCISNMVFAQKHSYKYGVVGQVGLLTGDAGEELSLQLINGVSKGKWFAGVGAGIDYYSDRSAPVFLDLRRDLTSKKNTPYLYADGGINISWLNTAQKNAKGFESDFKNGGYYDAGIGWKLKGKNDRAFLASVGYTYKQIKYNSSGSQWWLVSTIPITTTDYYNNTFKRIVVRIGFQL